MFRSRDIEMMCHAFDYVKACEGYKEYPFGDLQKQLTMKYTNEIRTKLEQRLFSCKNTCDIIMIQNWLNKLPIYLTEESTRKLHKCRQILNDYELSRIKRWSV